MDFSSFNIFGIGVATVAGFATGALWFSPKTFFPLWWRAMDKSEDEVPGKGTNMGAIFASLVGSMFIQAIILSAVINGLYENASIAQGVIAGVVIGLGISAMSSIGHRLFAGDGFLAWALEAGNDIAALAIMGAIIAAF
jgi:predicted secreted protein